MIIIFGLMLSYNQGLPLMIVELDLSMNGKSLKDGRHWSSAQQKKKFRNTRYVFFQIYSCSFFELALKYFILLPILGYACRLFCLSSRLVRDFEEGKFTLKKDSHKEPFNNYVDKMRWGEGVKNICFCPRSRYKNCPRKGRGGEVKKWQNSVHVIVE